MPDVTHVAEMRFTDLTDIKVGRIREIIVAALLTYGYIENQEFEIKTAAVDERVEWREREGTEPSTGQVGYLRSLYRELQGLLHNTTNVNEVKLTRELLATIKADMQQDSDGKFIVTKRRVSELINASKDAVAELTFTQKGVRTNEFAF